MKKKTDKEMDNSVKLTTSQIIEGKRLVTELNAFLEDVYTDPSHTIRWSGIRKGIVITNFNTGKNTFLQPNDA